MTSLTIFLHKWDNYLLLLFTHTLDSEEHIPLGTTSLVTAPLMAPPAQGGEGSSCHSHFPCHALQSIKLQSYVAVSLLCPLFKLMFKLQIYIAYLVKMICKEKKEPFHRKDIV